MTPQETVERALALSRADGCVAIVDETSTANLRFADNTLTTNGVARDRRLTVAAVHRGANGVSVGVVSRSGDVTGPEDVVRAAESAARESPPTEDARPLVATADAGAGSGWAEPPAETAIGVFEGLAPTLGEAFRRAGADERRLYGYAEHSLVSTFLGTSTGVRLRHDQPTGKIELNAKSGDLARSAWTGQSTRDFGDVDVAELDRDLVRRLEWAERRIDLPPGRYDTILSPSAMADLFVYTYASSSARDAHDGRTVFSRQGGGTRIGEEIASLPVTLRSDPRGVGLECSPYVVAHSSNRIISVFDNGLPLGATSWIRDGRIAALLQTRHSAELTGLPMTPYIDNLIFDGSGQGSLDDLVARTERGLLLSCLWYIRPVDPQTLLLTGLTRDGVYLVEHGEIVGAVNNFRFNESPLDMLGRLAEVGRTEITLPREWNDWFTRAAMPPARVEGFNMSSVSKAL